MDKIIFRMSSAGKCPRALSAQLLNMEAEPIPAFVEKAAEEGKWHEERIIDKLGEEEDYRIFSRQLEVKLEYPSFILIGHIDGIAGISPYDKEEPNKDYLLEIKTMSQYEFDRWMKGGFKAFLNYADQITCYMEATGLDECLYIVKNRSSGYEDRQVLKEQPSSFQAIVDKLTDVIQDTQDSRPAFQLSVATFDPQSIECRRCEYKKLCIPEPKELKPIERELLEATTEEWRKGMLFISQGKEIVDTARIALELHTRATNQFKWSFNKLAIQLVHYKESVTYSKAKLLEAFTEEQLEPASQVKEAFDQLRITDIGKDNERNKV